MFFENVKHVFDATKTCFVTHLKHVLQLEKKHVLKLDCFNLFFENKKHVFDATKTCFLRKNCFGTY